MDPDRPQQPVESLETAGKGHGRKSDAVRQQAVLALLSERTIARAAERCGVHERTLRKWLTTGTSFRAEYEAARTAAFEAGMSRVQALAGRAVDTLEDLLGATEHPTVRLGAARTVVELAVHQHEAVTIVRRLEEIEAIHRARDNRRAG